MKNSQKDRELFPRKGHFITHYPHTEEGQKKAGFIGITDCEKILAEWFGEEVVLLASGRSGLDLYMRFKGFNRYRDNLRIPAYLSRCVINALTPTVFPVHTSDNAAGVLFYHQYGFPQLCKPQEKVVIEDIAHSFFAFPNSGARNWIGEVSIFSLPKFFPITGMAGGLIIKDQKTAKKIRNIIHNTPRAPKYVRVWMRNIFSETYKQNCSAAGSIFLESAYELLLKFYQPDPKAMVGFPVDLEKIRYVGRQRRERAAFFFSYFGKDVFPAGFWKKEENLIPFALPYFGRGNLRSLEHINRLLEKEMVRAGIYHVDIRRNMYRPYYKPCLLLPCHQNISMDEFEKICRLIRTCDTRR